MANEVEVKLRITENGIEIFDDAGKKMEAFDKSVQRASGDEGGGGLKNFVKGMADAKAAYDIFSQSISQSAGLIDQVNQIGVVSLRAKAGYEALGGSADTIAKMQEATRGLVDDTLLYQEATHAMSSEAAKSADDLVQIAQIGATLGITFRGDAAQGVMDFTKAIESVGNVRSLRGLGIDVQAVRGRLEELKGTMSDSDAWRLAVFEVAGNNAKKLADNLSGTGTALERVKIRFDDFIEGQSENVAKGLEAIVGWWEQLEKNPTLTLTVTLKTLGFSGGGDGTASSSIDAVGQRYGINIDRQFNEQASALYRTGAGGSGAYQSLVNTYGQQVADEMMRAQGSNPAMLSQIGAQSGGFLPSYAQYIPNYAQMAAGNVTDVNQWGFRRGASIDMSLLSRPDIDSPIGGDQAYWARRRRAGLADTAIAGGDALREEFVAPVEAAQKQARELTFVKDQLGAIASLAGDYHARMSAVIAPLQEQSRILEQRKSIQSLDDAFGIERDGLYEQIGSGMSGAIAKRRDKYEQELKRKIGTGGRTSYATVDEIKSYDEKAKAERDAFEKSIGDPTAEELYKGGDYKKARMEQYDKGATTKRKAKLRTRKGKVYSQKDYEKDLAIFDQESKEAQDAYAIATGSATKESIKMNDQLEAARKNYEDGKTSLTQYKNELLLLGEAAKSGATSMDDLTQIQRKLNLDLSPGVRKGTKSTDSDQSLFNEYAGGVKGTKSATAAGAKETKPFDDIIANANQASAAATKIGTEGTKAIGTLVTSGALVVGKFGEMTTGADTALQKILTLKQTLSMLASIQINVTTTPKPSGSGSGERTSARGMR